MPARVPEPPPDKEPGRVPGVTPKASATQSPLRHQRPLPPAAAWTPMGLLSPYPFSHAGKENGITLSSHPPSPTPPGGSIPQPPFPCASSPMPLFPHVLLAGGKQTEHRGLLSLQTCPLPER